MRPRVILIAALLGVVLGIFAAWPKGDECAAALAALEQARQTRADRRARGVAGPAGVVRIPEPCVGRLPIRTSAPRHPAPVVSTVATVTAQGATADAIRAAWGAPDYVNLMGLRRAGRVLEQWVYLDDPGQPGSPRTFLYVERGVVVVGPRRSGEE